MRGDSESSNYDAGKQIGIDCSRVSACKQFGNRQTSYANKFVHIAFTKAKKGQNITLTEATKVKIQIEHC